MNHLPRLLAGAAGLAIIASACGGAAVAPSAAPAAVATTAAPAPTVAATPTPTVAPTPTKAVTPAGGQGATVAKLNEAKFAFDAGAAPYLPKGGYISTVSLVTLEKGGRTVAHKHGGVEAVFVLEGKVDLRTSAGRMLLSAGQGAGVAPDTALQAVNGGDGTAKFVAFFMTADGAAFQTSLTEPLGDAAAQAPASAGAKSVVAAGGQGATVAKLNEAKFAFDAGAAPYLPKGGYISTVSLVTLEKGGRTVAHKHGGVEAVFVLEGKVDLRTSAGRMLLSAGQGAGVAPDTALQAVNGGDGTAKFVAFFMTADGAAFQTNVPDAP